MILDQIPKKSGYNVFVDGVKQHTDIFLYSVIIEGVVYYSYKTKKPIVMPVISGDTFTYNGEAQGPTLTNLDGERYYTITGATATAAGTYTLTISLDNPDRTEWSDGTTADLTFSYTINPAHVMPPTVTNDGVYYSTDGTPKGPTVVDSVDVNKYTITGGSASVAGNYTMTVAINDKDNYIWEDTATTTDKTYAYEVKNVLLVAPPTVTVGTYTYSGSAQGPTVVNSADSDKYTITGATQTNAGSYTLTVSLNDATICRWSDTTDVVDKTYSYTIAKKSVTPPTVTNTSKTYSGSAQSPTVTNSADSAWYTVTNTAQTNAGSYSVTAALKAGTGGANVVWSDNTSANKSFAWSIAKANQSISVSPTSVSIGPSNANVTVSGGATTVSATSSNTGIATVSVSGNTVTINSTATAGTTTVSIYKVGNTNYNQSNTVSVSVSSTSTMGSLSKVSSVTALSVGRVPTASHVSSYALFAGGASSSSPSDTTIVETYNTSLTKGTTTNLKYARRGGSIGAYNGSYAIIAGGNASGSICDYVEGYNTSLSRTTGSVLSNVKSNGGGAGIGSYALIAGGYGKMSAESATVDTYNTSLTKGTATSLTNNTYTVDGTSNGSYVIFAGRSGSGSSSTYSIAAYNSSLTRSIPTQLSRCDGGATRLGSYAIFGGGTSGNVDVKTVSTYNTSLTKGSASDLSVVGTTRATSVGSYALFGFHYNNTTVDTYNTSLTKGTTTNLSATRWNGATESIGSYAIFAGGAGASAVVDAYKWS